MAGLQQRSFDDLGVPLPQVTFCVIDLETTGSSAGEHGITEIGAVKVRGGEVLGSFQTLVNPGCAIPPSITLLTGITESMVLPAPRIDAVLPTLLEFIGSDGADDPTAGTVIVGHNIRFDLGFLNAALERSGRPRLTHRSLDTLALARRLVRDEVPDCRLGTLASRLRLDHQPSHRALDDVLATVDLLHLLIERAASYGAMGLDDLITLPAIANHPLAPKLRHTDQLPRSPGVYMFLGPRDDVLYVGKATNLRQRVRSYFSAHESRRKVGALLRETQRITHITTPDPLSAAVLEVRLLHRHEPRYNRQGLTWSKYCYVRLTTEEAFPRLSIVRDPGATGIHIGPLPSRAMASLVVEAIQSVVPLRRCSQRIPRSYRAPDGATPCTSAQLGVAWCPCSGGVDVDTYARAVDTVRRGLTENADLLLGPLADRMTSLACEQRYEEAALVRDRASALITALDRQRRVDALRRAGRVELSFGNVVAHLDHGRLDDVRHEGQLLGGLPEPPAELTPLDRPLPRRSLDEVLCIARHLDAEQRPFRVLHAEHEWHWPIPSVSEAFTPQSR